jgi:hypothetical protein
MLQCIICTPVVDDMVMPQKKSKYGNPLYKGAKIELQQTMLMVLYVSAVSQSTTTLRNVKPYFG